MKYRQYDKTYTYLQIIILFTEAWLLPSPFFMDKSYSCSIKYWLLYWVIFPAFKVRITSTTWFDT